MKSLTTGALIKSIDGVIDPVRLLTKDAKLTRYGDLATLVTHIDWPAVKDYDSLPPNLPAVKSSAGQKYDAAQVRAAEHWAALCALLHQQVLKTAQGQHLLNPNDSYNDYESLLQLSVFVPARDVVTVEDYVQNAVALKRLALTPTLESSWHSFVAAGVDSLAQCGKTLTNPATIPGHQAKVLLDTLSKISVTSALITRGYKAKLARANLLVKLSEGF